MVSARYIPPRLDELEISVFGPGYGESAVVHMGNGEWIIIDSCIERDSGKPVALDYIESMGLDASECVKLIVVSHWHDDHVKGISDVFRKCTAAELAISAALESDSFLALVAAFRGETLWGSSGINELVKVFRIRQERKARGVRLNSATLAIADRPLYVKELDIQGGKYASRMYALSPSDSAVTRAGIDFYQRLPSVGDRRRNVACPSQNLCSVVLWIEIGDKTVLLGSDLETSTDPSMGWKVVLGNSKIARGKASLFKIPHHGSESGHCDEVWSELLITKPLAVLSPYRLAGTDLPTAGDVTRINTLTDNAYITASPIRRKTRIRDRVVREFVQTQVKSIEDLNFGCGQVRVRRSIAGKDDNYAVELFEDARVLSDIIFPGPSHDAN